VSERAEVAPVARRTGRNSAKLAQGWLALSARVRCSQLDGAVARWAAPRPGYVRGGDEQDQPTAEPAAERVADQAAHSSTATLAVAGWRRSVRAAEAVGVVVTKSGRSLRLISYVRYSTEPAVLTPTRAVRQYRQRSCPFGGQVGRRAEGGQAAGVGGCGMTRSDVASHRCGASGRSTRPVGPAPSTTTPRPSVRLASLAIAVVRSSTSRCWVRRASGALS
jgi:hypothetical protein